MAVAYIYRSPVGDIETKIAASAGVTPLAVKSAWSNEVAIFFEAALSADDKVRLDAFMTTRGLTYHRQDMAESIGSSFEPSYYSEEYDDFRLVRIAWYGGKSGDDLINKRKEITYAYDGAKVVSETITTYASDGSVESIKTFNITAKKVGSIMTIIKEVT